MKKNDFDYTMTFTKVIQEEIEKYSSAYVTITSDFLKWNTAFAVGGILWLSNFITTSTHKLALIQIVCVLGSLFLLLLTIVVSIVIFYFFTHYFNSKWKLYSEWQKCVDNGFYRGESEDQDKEERRIATEFNEPELLKQIKDFNQTVYVQMSLLIIGYGLMCGFVFTLAL
jgi:hypothetical protein